IKDLEIGRTISGQVYLLAESRVDKTRKGDPYLRATLADSTGRLEARSWNLTPEVMEQLEVGSGVRIYGTVEEYPAGSRQVRIERLQPVEIQDFSRFLPQAKRDREEMRQELLQVRAQIKHPYLSRLLDRLFGDEEFEATFSRAPAAKRYHHACIGGLLEHTLAVVRLCSFVAHEHTEIHRDLLLTAAILHDVGKATSYTLGPVLDLTEEGRLINHVAQGALAVQTAIDSLEGFPQNLRNRLLHAILAHHGALERGSPVAPQTMEALALHHADWMDGDVRGFLDFVESEPPSADGWTGFSSMFGTRLYPGPVESPEEDEEVEQLPF
ncbi:MAG TPA: HD domain-containing protein, partial [Anaerolineae bacterium]|nr:HD domain-containing protein [Anaerolineae bacterium]